MTDWKELSVDPEVVEAFAEAWATIDGKLRMFLDCKRDPECEKEYGFYEGYMADAKELLSRVDARMVKTKEETQ